MAIGILALVFGAVSFGIGCAGIGKAEPIRQEEKKIVYPYPREIS